MGICGTCQLFSPWDTWWLFIPIRLKAVFLCCILLALTFCLLLDSFALSDSFDFNQFNSHASRLHSFQQVTMDLQILDSGNRSNSSSLSQDLFFLTIESNKNLLSMTQSFNDGSGMYILFPPFLRIKENIKK